MALPPLRPTLPVPFPLLRLPSGPSGASMQHAERGVGACTRIHAASVLAMARLYIRTCVAYALPASRLYACVVYVVMRTTFVHTDSVSAYLLASGDRSNHVRCVCQSRYGSRTLSGERQRVPVHTRHHIPHRSETRTRVRQVAPHHRDRGRVTRVTCHRTCMYHQSHTKPVFHPQTPTSCGLSSPAHTSAAHPCQVVGAS